MTPQSSLPPIYSQIPRPSNPPQDVENIQASPPSPNPPADGKDSQASQTDKKTPTPWFIPEVSEKWYAQTVEMANRTYLSDYFNKINYQVPEHTYALIAPLKLINGKLSMQYYSYGDTAFTYSMTKDGQENYWPASTVKLTAAVMALIKLKEYKQDHKTIVNFTDIEGEYNDTVQQLCEDAIIPSNNTAYNRLMEIAGFDEINDKYLPKIFHFPNMILQRRYVRHHPDDNLRESPEINYTKGDVTGKIKARKSSGKIRPQCPRESNCTTLAELAEVMFRVVCHEDLDKKRRLPLRYPEIRMLREALLKAPSCIGNGVANAMGQGTAIYNKGGKVTSDDRLEVAVVGTRDKPERYLIALSMPYYEGVETETNHLAQVLIEAMKARNDKKD